MIHSLIFDQGKLVGRDVPLPQLRAILEENGRLIWVDLENATEEEAHSVLGEDLFNFHPLAINDCHEAISTPKAELYENIEPWRPSTFVVVHEIEFSAKDDTFRTVELDIFVGKNFLVTWHTTPLRPITQTIERCLKSPPRGADRMLHTILDFLVEGYQPAVRALSDRVLALQDRVFTDPSQRTLNKILGLKKQVTQLRQIIEPQHELITRLARGEFKIIRPQLLPYFRDVHDALDRISNAAESYNDQLTNTLHVYLSHSSNQINEVVKVLTILNAISLPPLVIASIYGMNLKLPEFQWAYGYLWSLGLMAATTCGLLIWLKSKKWF